MSDHGKEAPDAAKAPPVQAVPPQREGSEPTPRSVWPIGVGMEQDASLTAEERLTRAEAVLYYLLGKTHKGQGSTRRFVARNVTRYLRGREPVLVATFRHKLAVARRVALIEAADVVDGFPISGELSAAPPWCVVAKIAVRLRALAEEEPK